ncbi:AAA family ATPase [Ornithinibacillus sp. L9]|uniref:AAA family ATPase n=1 Tax=Ornithinibacillus caprae TaxID=2678566 RepID=A0A6N8FHM7_9BACI|nr:ATP-binding protein [Ornithinibacillus caprae]MUK88196.1 AAA family ATPase [Ornithinibacillus caprae]
MNKLQDILPKMNISNDSDRPLYKMPGRLTKATDDCMYRECDGSGLIHVIKENGYEVMMVCKCKEYKELLEQIKTARIPADYLDKRINDFDIKMYQEKDSVRVAQYAKKIATSYVTQYPEMEDMGKELYFYSNTKGSGKTLLSIAITNELIIKYQIKPIYISVVNMLNEMKHSFTNKDSNRNFYNLMESFKQAPVLVMDDLGVEKTTDWSEEVLTQILDERMSYKRPTIITSNKPIQLLHKMYPAGRIKSRIEKMTFPALMPEESVREIIARQENEQIAKLFLN